MKYPGTKKLKVAADKTVEFATGQGMNFSLRELVLSTTSKWSIISGATYTFLSI